MPTTITVDGIPVRVLFSKRKSLKLQVTDRGEVRLEAPVGISSETIIRFVQEHRNWILKKREIILKRDPKVTKREFVSGESFLYLGRYYRLKLVDNQREPLIWKDGWFYLSKKHRDNAREVFIRWYRKQAKIIIPKRVRWYALLGGFKYNRVFITNAKKRWGSYTGNGNLNFSWRLVMAPMGAIDYVVVHELVHTLEPRHTPEFWGKVKVLLPDYEKWKSWLDEYGYILTNII